MFTLIILPAFKGNKAKAFCLTATLDYLFIYLPVWG